MLNVGNTVSNRSRTETGFVRKYAAADTVADGRRKARSDKSANCGVRRKRVLEDRCEHTGHVSDVPQQVPDRRGQVHDYHRRHKRLCGLGNTLDPSQQHQTHRDCDKCTRDPLRNIQAGGRPHRLNSSPCNRVGLHHVAGAKQRRGSAKDGEQYR